MKKTHISPIYKALKKILSSCYPSMELLGAEQLPQEPCAIVSNHAQIHGPLSCELCFPEPRYTWCAGEMMHLRDVPNYAFQDFWSGKPRSSQWFYRLMSYAVAPVSAFVFNNADTIGVYHDARAANTFKETLRRLQQGANVIIFPEHNTVHNHIVYEFQDKFVDVAKLYYKKLKKELCFVPMYIAPRLKKMVLGPPVRFCAAAEIAQERARICKYLMAQITQLAQSLPLHTVVPYRNIPKKNYPCNLPQDTEQK